MPHVHSQPCSQRATQSGHPQEGALGDTPSPLACLTLVKAVSGEGDDIEGQQADQCIGNEQIRKLGN